MAGALTFFPPEPALYQFERHSAAGRVLGPDEDPKDPETVTMDDKDDDDSSIGEIPGRDGRTGPLEISETRARTHKKIQSPAEQLTDQVNERRKRSKIRSIADARDHAAGVTYRLLLDPRLMVPPHDEHSIQAIKIPAKGGTFVAAVLYRVPAERCTETTKTIVISHGNATDLGAMFPIQVVIAHSLDCHVLVYDYSGYGESGGIPTECATYRDIEAVYDYVMEHVAAGNAKNVILYGQSVGSGPCCHLIAKREAAVGGLILHSPFTSGMRVLTPSRLLACLDIYPNIDRICKVQCPVLVIHGCLDQEVDVSHGQELYHAVPQQYKREPWWVRDRGHNDITEGPGKLAEYIRRLRRFLNSLNVEENSSSGV